LSSGTSGGVLSYTADGTLASSALLTQHAPVMGGGAGVAPSTIAAGATGQVLKGNTGAAASWGRVDSADIDDGTIVVADVSKSGLTGNTGATATAGVGTMAEYVGGVHTLVYTFTNVVLNLTNGADNADSQQIITFPEGRIYVLGAAWDATVTVTTNVWEDSGNDIFYVGIGTAAADQNATLAGTEQDIMAVQTLDTVAALVDAVHRLKKRAAKAEKSPA
jgi:hypothetical protein